MTRQADLHQRGWVVKGPRANAEKHGRALKESSHCEAPGCYEATREHKPYCSKHIELLPGVQEILAEIERRRAEAELVARGRLKATVASPHAQEIMVRIRQYGPRSVARLSRDLALPRHAVRLYAQALKRAGLVTLGRTSRSSTVISLVGAPE